MDSQILIELVFLIFFAGLANMIIMIQCGIFALDTTFWSADRLRKELTFSFVDSIYRKKSLQDEDVHSRLTDDIDIVTESMNWMFDTAAQIVIAIVTTVALLLISWQLTLFCLSPLFLLQLLLKLTHKKLEVLAETSRASGAAVTSGIKNIFGSATTIFAFGRQSAATEYLKQLNQARMEASLRFRLLDEFLNSFSTSIFYLGTSFSLIGVALFYRSLHLDLHNIIIFVFFLPFSSGLITLFGDLAPQLNSLLISVNRLREVDNNFLNKSLNEEHKVEPSKLPLLKTMSIYQNAVSEDDSNTIVTVFFGQKIAIFGGVGSGKTSFLRAITGDKNDSPFYVKWNDYTLKSEDNLLMFPRITYSSQVPILFADSIENNMKLHRDISKNDLQKSLGVADLLQDQLNLESSVGVAGSQLSGGQRQRLALARSDALVADILALDDPFSSLDEKTAQRVWNNLRNHRQQTLIVATNREFVLRESDLIVYLVDHRIVASGSFQQLEKQFPEIRDIVL
jgi:ATP-binding cassette, subfamily B, bacterial